MLEIWIVVEFQRTEGLRNMRMGLNTLSHLQYKIQQARYQLDGLPTMWEFNGKKSYSEMEINEVR